MAFICLYSEWGYIVMGISVSLFRKGIFLVFLFLTVFTPDLIYGGIENYLYFAYIVLVIYIILNQKVIRRDWLEVAIPFVPFLVYLVLSTAIRSICSVNNQTLFSSNLSAYCRTFLIITSFLYCWL